MKMTPHAASSSLQIITTHVNADFDGLASMVAGRKLYPGALLVLPGGAQEAVRRFLSTHDVGLTPIQAIDRSRVTRLVLMDTHDPDRIGSLKELCFTSAVSVHVYDHHTPKERRETSPAFRPERETIEPVGSTTALLIEQLKAARLSVTPFEATVLALGLYEETGSFAYPSTTPRDFEAGAYAVQAGADLVLVSETLHRPPSPEFIALLNQLLHSREAYSLDGRSVWVVVSTFGEYRGDLAGVVERLFEMADCDAVVALCAMQEKLQIIARSRRAEIDVGRLLQAFGGGGHPMAAAATVKGRTLPEVKEEIAELLTHRFRPAAAAQDVMTAPVKTVPDSLTMVEADLLLTKYGVTAAPVVTRTDRYLGILTRETVQRGLFHRLGDRPVTDFLQRDAYTASPETPFRDIRAAMIERNQRCVPVLFEGKPTGIITRTDVLRTLHGETFEPRSGDGEAPPHSRRIDQLMKGRLPEAVFALLRRAAEEAHRTGVKLYAVGGFVRDLLLHRPNLDVDLVVEGDELAYARTLAEVWKAEVTTHDRFGTAVLVLPDGLKVDVATARTEYYEYPTALPTVERSSIKKDLFRRDFTINALAVRLNGAHFGELLDFYGGRRDLHEKTIRVLHSLSFIEDPTRIFRAVRFEQRFGFRLANDTLALIKSAVKGHLIERLSGSRLREELILLLSEAEPVKGIMRLHELKILRVLHPAFARASGLAAGVKFVETVVGWYRLLYLNRSVDEWVVYFLALMDAIPESAVREVLARLNLSARHAAIVRTGRVQSAELLRRLARPRVKPSDIHRWLAPLPDEVLLFLMAKTASQTAKRAISTFVTTGRTVKPALTGKDLHALGVKPGPIYRTILDALLKARLDGEAASEQDERKLVKRLLARRPPSR